MTAFIQIPEDLIVRPIQTSAPDTTGLNGRDLEALYRVYCTIGDILAGFLCQPRFDDGQNAAGQILEEFAESVGRAMNSIAQAAEHITHTQEAASLLIRHELNNGNNAAGIAARAASLALNTKN